MTGSTRFDPERELPGHLEYRDWRAARWPATARSWRVRRWVARRIEAFASGFDLVAAPFLFAGRAIRNFADFVHGQPRARIELNLAGLPPRSVSAYVKRVVHSPRRPFAPEDLDFLASYCSAIPEALDALDPELRAAVLGRRGGAA
jgi:hypothetical protein